MSLSFGERINKTESIRTNLDYHLFLNFPLVLAHALAETATRSSFPDLNNTFEPKRIYLIHLNLIIYFGHL